MTQHLTADEAAALLLPKDSLAMPLGPGQPPAFLEALGRRSDWEHLRIGGALLTVLTDLFSHPNVHYLSGYFGPLERLLRDSGANIGFAPADFRRFTPILEADPPRVMATAAAPPDADGRVSLSLHAGASVGQIRQASADPERLLVVEVSPAFPRTYGVGDYVHSVHLDEIDVLIESGKAPIVTEDPPPTDTDRAIAEHVRAFVPDGATLQTGIGAVPSMVASLLAEGDGGGYGVHSEMFTTGLMRLHQAGKVTNQKGTFDGVSVATFAAGTRELYDWLHENHEVAFLPVDLVNSPEAIARNRAMVTINAAMSVDIQGQVIADTINAVQYSGIGGHEDFVSGPALALDDRSLLCLPATITLGDQLHSRIVPWFQAGAVITTPRHQVVVVVSGRPDPTRQPRHDPAHGRRPRRRRRAHHRARRPPLRSPHHPGQRRLALRPPGGAGGEQPGARRLGGSLADRSPRHGVRHRRDGRYRAPARSLAAPPRRAAARHRARGPVPSAARPSRRDPRIPMAGSASSLNVAVAHGIVLHHLMATVTPHA